MELCTTKSATEKDQRLAQARLWLQQLDVDLQSDFHAIAGDASGRRYYRLRANGESRVLMDAPPPGENVEAFIDINRRLRAANLHAPEIVHADRQNGYLLLEDLGDNLYRELLHEHSVDVHFAGLFDVLKSLALTVDSRDLPAYDAKMLRTEMDLFPDWYLDHHRKTMPREKFDALWDAFCERIISSALEQPRCFVHRDFHSSNLLETSSNSVGIIDFQDAVRGPLSYDFISLIWDRHINWPRLQIEHWMEEFRLKLGLEMTPETWLRYCDLMGLQRNIKIVGIFARLRYRDGKNAYIKMIPRFYDYIITSLRRYPEFSGLLEILEQPACVP